MANTQPLHATFFAFRKREKGGVLFGATVAYIVLLAVILVGFVAVNIGSLQAFGTWYMGAIQQAAQNPGAPPDMSGMPQGLGLLALSYFLVIFFSMLLLASYEAACLRWMVRGETGGLFGLSLGSDTWRVWLGYWIWFFIFLAFYLLLVFAFAASGVSMAMSVGGKGEVNPFMPLVVFAVCLAVIALWIFVAVRLAPGAATSVIAKRFAMFDAWNVTKGRFWALLGAFAVLWILYIVAILVIEMALGVTIGVGVAAAIGGGASDPSAATAALLRPQMLILFAVIYVAVIAIAMVFYVALFGANARAAVAAAEEGKIPGVTPPQAAAFS
jgi:hypothetical protein